ncbi:MAG TPA: oligosaccharide flippase family protein [Kofleriaceae bacterium]|nr:oligosaccharide flippase family protein [Kofleriaceae bacterium]
MPLARGACYGQRALPDDQQQGTGAGRGVLYIAFAKFYFMIAGMVVQFRLPVILPTAVFGAYSLVNSIASWFNNVAVTGTIQAVSKFAAEEPGKARAVQHAGLRMHLRLGLPIALVFIAAAPLVARFILDDPSKTMPLMLAGLIIGGYSFYATFIGTANGLRQFNKQAGLDISFATLRTAGLLGMAIAGFGVVGVIGGWVAAVGGILILSVAWIGLPRTRERLSVRPMFGYFTAVAVYLVLFNGVMFADSILVKRLMSQYYQTHAAAGSASTLADVQVAYYAAVQNLGRVSYQLIIAATFVVFPLVSRSTFTDDRETTRRYIQVTTRYSLMFAMVIGVIMASRPVDALALLYKPDYAAAGGPALVALGFGNVAFSMFAIAGTILNSARLTRAAIVSAGITLAAAVIGNYIAIPLAAGSGHVLEVAASVTGGAMLLGAVVSGWQLHRHLGASLPLASLARIAIATAVAYAVGHWFPLHGKLMTLVAAVAIGVTFLIVLVATRELGKRDLEAIKQVRRNRAPGGDVP